MVYALDKLLPFDIWLLIIMSNCLLTALQTCSVIVVGAVLFMDFIDHHLQVYALFAIEARCRHAWDSLDDILFVCRCVTRAAEFVLALAVIIYGLYQSVFGAWSSVSAVVLLVHSYFNVYRRLQAGWATFQQRQLAQQNIK